MASLEQRIRTAAAAYAPLAALLSSGSPLVFRWYDSTPAQGFVYPAVVAFLVSNPASYCFTSQLRTSFARVQFTIWGGQFAPGVDAADAVGNALQDFLNQLNLQADGRAGIQQNNLIVGNRRAVFTLKDTQTYQRVVDAQIFSDDSA